MLVSANQPANLQSTFLFGKTALFFSGYHSETIMYLGKLMDVRICLGEISPRICNGAHLETRYCCC